MWKNKDVQKEWMAQWSVDNREKIYTAAAIRKREYKKWAINHLGGECVECGDVDNLEFDHINPGNKDKHISDVMSSRNKLTEELKKCQLLCKSCHKEKTKRQRKLSWRLLSLMPQELQEKWENNPPTSVDDIINSLQYHQG